MAVDRLDACCTDDETAAVTKLRGVFSDWVSMGTVRLFDLGKKCFQDRRALHTRERCPHCKGDVFVRKNTNYYRNRRVAIRAHLRACEWWACPVPLPRYRRGQKLMEDPLVKRRQLHLDFFIHGRQVEQ